MTEARREVIVDEAGGLHEGVADGGPHEGEAAPLEIAAERLRDGGLRRYVPRLAPAILERTILHEAPHVGGEAPVLAPHGEKGPGVGDGALDLAAVADDARVAQEPPHVGGGETRDPRGVEGGEGRAITAPPGEDGRPAQPRLRAFQHEELEEPTVGSLRDAPLAIVIGDVGRATSPGAAWPRGGQRHSV